MRFSCLLLLLSATLAVAQGAPAAPPAAAAPIVVAPDAPVITLEGYCAAKESGKVEMQNPLGPPCKLVVTRAQFEQLARDLRPGSDPATMGDFARAYAEILVGGNDAIKMGLDKDPKMSTLMDFYRMQILSVLLSRHYRTEAEQVSDADLQTYYNDNPGAFEEVKVERCFVPKQLPGKPADPAAAKAQADALRARAAQGEAFATLQKEAYAGSTQTPPPTEPAPVRRGQVPAGAEAMIFGLKVGEVSQVLDEPAGFYFFRMDGKRTLPFADVKEQIRRQLAQQKLQELMKSVTGIQPVLNPGYFTAPPAPAAAPPQK